MACICQSETFLSLGVAGKLLVFKKTDYTVVLDVELTNDIKPRLAETNDEKNSAEQVCCNSVVYIEVNVTFAEGLSLLKAQNKVSVVR